ncbi:helix-turn-helix domain-containing protein [Gryllotalpicola protaetiae]|uniref:helix-turn-helix domain-containing protein n=1 Tax=Gryllotalpicola protaetiae TaxID=2419771 RepID=UPI0013C4C4A9|nr:helix-turn-helix domain-containing protein [Gryllotalpicola protaetiae]
MIGPALRMRDAARYCGIAYNTLKYLRYRRLGPTSYRHGGLVVFYQDDLDAWMRGRLEREPGVAQHSTGTDAA